MLNFLLGVLVLGAGTCLNAAYVEVLGGKLFYETYGKGEAVVVLHGGPGLDHSIFLPQFLDLKDEFQVTLYDQRGSGRSIPFPYTEQAIHIDNFIKDLDAIRLMLKAEKIRLIGHSWGGILAMEYAMSHPQNVAKLVLLNSSLASFEAYEAFVVGLNKKLRPIQPKLDAITGSDAFKKGEAKALESYYRMLFREYFFEPKDAEALSIHCTTEGGLGGIKVFEQLYKSYLSKFDLRIRLKSLKVPTLILHGSGDVAPIMNAEELKKLIPNSTLKVIASSGHFSYVDKAKEVFSEIRKFFKSHG